MIRARRLLFLGLVLAESDIRRRSGAPWQRYRPAQDVEPLAHRPHAVRQWRVTIGGMH